MLGKIDQSLVSAAKEHVPSEAKSSKKRKAEASSDGSKVKKKKAGDMSISEREDKATENLIKFIEEKGGSPEVLDNFRCSITKTPGGKHDTSFYNDKGKRFRSMVEVARHFGLVAEAKRSAAAMKRASLKKKKTTSREIEAEKKKLRKELEKLRKQHTKATKALDDFLTDEKDAQYPIEDSILQEEEEAKLGKPSEVLPTNCAAARIPDIESFDGLPKHCMPDVLVAWDFLCTFTRAISVNPISLDDFIHCLNYKPPKNLSDSDALSAPPIFLGEAHLGLLKLILADKASDDWWWSILETPVTENAIADFADTVDKDESDLPLIKVDFAALLSDPEEPLITTSWLQALLNVQYMKANDVVPIKSAIKTAMGIVANKFVMAYLRKALKLGKTSGPSFMKRAVIWLSDRVREARPDLIDRSISKDKVFKQRAKVVDEVSQQMDKLSSAALAVNDEDLLSDAEDSDDESDDSDVEEDKENMKDATVTSAEPDERPASYIPHKPSPSLVDFLLPPGKPAPPSELLNPYSWPHLAGAAACRILHRYRRLRNEVDDSLRLSKELPRITVKQRRQREISFKSRVLTEFVVDVDGKDLCKKAVEHLCDGGNYLDLTPVERLCILRILIEAAYDTNRVYEVIDSNHKQRTNAIKALETEQRRAKREAKEKAAENESFARQDLSLQARRNFIEEKREEIRKANEANHELTNDEIDELTEEDIIEFDDDIKADFEALPAPESYKKAEVVARVAQILEADAFDTELLTVLTMEDVLEREKAHKESLEESLQALGGEDALMDPVLDRDTYRAIEKVRRELSKIQASSESLPGQRETAIDTLNEAIADGTIKSLRGSIRIAKAARLFGRDEHTNGIWALDIVRDAHMELENAKQHKRVADAQKDLISKRNKCFIRTEPLGSDRFGNRFWRFENSEQGHVWSEVDYVIEENSSSVFNKPGFLEIVADVGEVAIGHPDVEEDFAPSDQLRQFTRQEYHQSGTSASLTKRNWGCHISESSVLALTKGLDSRGVRENHLKMNLKEALEEKAMSNGKDAVDEEEADTVDQFNTSGDEAFFVGLKQSARELESDIINLELLAPLTSGIDQNVRIRTVVERTKDLESARYEVGSITGWKIRKDEVPLPLDDDDDDFEPKTKIVESPVWRALTERGNEVWLTGTELLESICRHAEWKSKENYFESDAAFLSYRNALGRYFGRAADAAHAMTPIRFTQYMVKREAEIYQKLKHHVFDNSWGGKAGARNAWVTSMRDFAFDFETAKEGLLTFENALFELTGGSSDDTIIKKERSARDLLDDPMTREDIELESLEKGVNGLWNSRESRDIFIEIVKGSKTVGFLELALELVCRNTRVYMEANKIQTVSTQETSYGTSMRTGRRANAWQSDSFFFDGAPSSRRSRSNVFYGGME